MKAICVTLCLALAACSTDTEVQTAAVTEAVPGAEAPGDAEAPGGAFHDARPGTASDAGLTAGERRAVDALLHGREGWALATEADNADRAGLQEQRTLQPGYQPYVGRADLDMDGRTDLAAIFREDATFALYWFRAREDGFAPGELLARSAAFARAGLFVNQGILMVAAFQGDPVYHLFQWDSDARALVAVQPGSS